MCHRSATWTAPARRSAHPRRRRWPCPGRGSPRPGGPSARRPASAPSGRAAGPPPCSARGQPGLCRSDGRAYPPRQRCRGIFATRPSPRALARSRRLACGARRAQQRVRAHRHGQAGGEPCTGLAAHGQGDAPMQGADTLGATRMRPGDVIQPLGEGSKSAIRLVAAEPPGSDPQGDGATLPGQVAHATPASAVDATRNGATAGTGGVPAAGTCQDRHALLPREDLLDVERSGNEAEARGRHRRAPWSAAGPTSVGDLPRQYNPHGCTISAGGPASNRH